MVKIIPLKIIILKLLLFAVIWVYLFLMLDAGRGDRPAVQYPYRISNDCAHDIFFSSESDLLTLGCLTLQKAEEINGEVEFQQQKIYEQFASFLSFHTIDYSQGSSGLLFQLMLDSTYFNYPSQCCESVLFAWETQSLELVAIYHPNSSKSIRDIVSDDTGDTVFYLEVENNIYSIKQWYPLHNRHTHLLSSQTSINSIFASHDGKSLGYVSNDTAYIFSISHGKVEQSLASVPDAGDLFIYVDQKSLVDFTEERILFFDIVTKNQLHAFTFDKFTISNTEWSNGFFPKTRYFSAYNTDHIFVWDVSTGALVSHIQSFEDHKFSTAIISEDGKIIIGTNNSYLLFGFVGDNTISTVTGPFFESTSINEIAVNDRGELIAFNSGAIFALEID